jgi:NDP-sugar pyrophosphorylase family protein
VSSKAVILAGGTGSRLAPYTTVLPKPLMPIGDRAILDVIVRQLAAYGFTDLTFAVGYLGHLIKAVFGDGSDHGVSIEYLDEPEPLGTAGPLRQLGEVDETLLVMNGDLLTNVDYRKFLDLHRESRNAMTIATHRRVVHVNYGVLHVAGTAREVDVVTGYDEKPELPYIVSMGVYALEPRAIEVIPEGRFDIPDLVLRLLEVGEPVGSYLFDGYWLDIGRHDDYQQALDDYEEVLPKLLPSSSATSLRADSKLE